MAAPQVTYILHELQNRGFQVDMNATTIEEAAETVADAVRMRKKR